MSSLANIARLAVWAFLVFVMAEVPLGAGELYGSPEESRRGSRLSAWTGDLPARLAITEESAHAAAVVEASLSGPKELLLPERGDQPDVITGRASVLRAPGAHLRSDLPRGHECDRASVRLSARGPPSRA